MKFTLITTLLMFCLSCGIAVGQMPVTGPLPALSADSQLPNTISPNSPPPLIDMSMPSPSWQSAPETTLNVVPFGYSATVSQGGWYARGESMFLQLSHGTDVRLIYNLVDLGGAGSQGAIVAKGPIISTNTISSNQFDVVPRVTLGYQFHDGFGLEATYFGRSDWSSASSAAATSASTFLGTPDGLLSNGATTSLATSLHSFELNAIQSSDANRNLELMIGLRYFRLNEQFTLHTESDVNNSVYQSHYNLQTTNNLYGAQFGIRWGIQRNRWSLNAVGKSGIYANDASQQQFFGYSANLVTSPPRDMSSSKTGLSFIQELGINGVYQLTESWSIRGGYNLFVIQGLARASEQIDFSANMSPSLQTHGSAVLHGPSAGLEYRF